jgi:long-subunit acyl-CoA synthetase (AMP-forming)
MLHDHDNAITIIDKKDNLVKMSSGNVLSPVKLEPIYNLCLFVKNVWVYSESSWDFPVAVINVYEKQFVQLMNKNGMIGKDWVKFCASDK